MAQRGKRINRNDNDSASCPGAIKRRKCRAPTATDTPVPVAALGPSEEEEAMASSSQGGSSWTPRPLSDIKISSIYNRSAAEPPAELYRKDLISAMKLPDSEPLSPSEYWVISDQWKQEWEKGVQVPVNPDSLPEPTVTHIQTPPMSKLYGEFKLPRKYVRILRDDFYNPEEHYLSTTPQRAEKACGYDLDDTDIAWLEVLNGERALCGQSVISETQLERVLEELEHCCWDKIQTIVKNDEGLGIEYDENAICDVCRSPDSEEGNEMVFCDLCNICVHQACYGITSIPEGSWLCRTCTLGQRPKCVLCPNAGGAMKSTRNGRRWAHVSCALWIPEVSIGCVERMEPITKISSIPQSRWQLLCVLCRERVGACIQCSIKTCKTAYHVTCAFKHGLEMKAIIEDEQAEDGVKLRSYCQKHGKINVKDRTASRGAGSTRGSAAGSDSDEGEVRRRERKDMSSEEKNQARATKLQEIEAEFDKHVSLNDITNHQLDVDSDALVYIYNYWKLKRRAGHNKPLLPPRCGDLSGSGARAQSQAADTEKMKKFVQLRQDLERVRNLCYMVNKREKLCRSFIKLREQIFHKQMMLAESGSAVSTVLEANHGPSIYDHLYSHDQAEKHSHDLDSLLERIQGLESNTPNDKKHPPDFNGASNKRLHFNGTVTRKKLYSSESSSISGGEIDQPKIKASSTSKSHTDKKLLSKAKVTPKRETDSSTEDDDKQSKASSSKVSPRRKPKKTGAPDRPRTSIRKILNESSESDSKPEAAATRSRTLQHMERELGSVSGSDSDDLISFGNNKSSAASRLKPTEIYSDTDSSSLDRASAKLSTKASTKSLSSNESKKKDKDKHKTKEKDLKDPSRESLFEAKKDSKNKENQKSASKKDCMATALIVPQRQAAKKASEIMQRSQGKKELATSAGSDVSQDVKPAVVEDAKPSVKPPKDTSKEPKSSSTTTTPQSSKKSKQDGGKSSAKDTPKSNDIYDFDKEPGDEIFAYVPQRQAAKKAAEHIKSNISAKATTHPPETEAAADSSKAAKKDGELAASTTKKKQQDIKKEDSPAKDESPSTPKKPVKKPVAAAAVATKVQSDSSSSSSSSSSCSSSSDSSSDSDDSKSAEQTTRRSSTTKERTLLSSSTSSESESESASTSPAKNAAAATKGRASKGDGKAEAKSDDEERRQSSISSLSGTGRKLKKLPDKKLKTSDGRRGHEFQPPSTERDEPSRSPSSGHKDHEQQHKDGRQRQQQLADKHKPSAKESAAAGKRSVAVQPQQHRHQQQHQPQAQADEGVLGGPRDNDGSRNLPGLKPAKRLGQAAAVAAKQHDQQQRSPPPDKPAAAEKEPAAKGKATAAEARKRKSAGQVSQKEEKAGGKDAAALKKVEKRLSERSTERSGGCSSSSGWKERDSSASRERVATVEPMQKASTPAEDSPSRTDRRSKKGSNNKSAAAPSLEEEIKQRKAKQESPKKTSRGLDKLLEKREHENKLSKSKTSESAAKPSRPDSPDRAKSQDRNNHHSAETRSSSTKSALASEASNRVQGVDAAANKKDLADTPLAERLNEHNKKKTEEKLDIPPIVSEHNNDALKHQHHNKDETPGSQENLFSRPTPDKHAVAAAAAVNESCEKENKRRKSVNRSIFSPQHGSKDPSVPDLFDFDQDMLTDDMVSDDGFSISRDAAAAPPFSFSNELWFKEDTKEDSARETLNLVEKLRMGMSKRSNSSQFDLESSVTAATAAVSVDADVKALRSGELKLKAAQQLQTAQDAGSKVPPTSNLKSGNNATLPHLANDAAADTQQQLDHKQKPFANNSEAAYVGYSSGDLDGSKVAMADRAKLDRAEADERWVPPSTDTFNTAEQHLNAFIDSHRYDMAAHQFPNDLGAAVLADSAIANAASNPLVHSQLHMDVQQQHQQQQQQQQEQQQQQQQQQQFLMRPGQPLDPHADPNRLAQGAAHLVEQTVGPIPTHMIEEVQPFEMVTRHLMGMPGASMDDDQTSEMDRTLDKEDLNSDVTRQDYAAGASPYNDMASVRQDTRWAESQVLPSRRSTSSSITSASSVDDHAGIPPYKQNNAGSGMPPMSFPPCSVEAAVSSYHSYEAGNSYSGPVSLFPPQANSGQMPYSSSGAAMFPPPIGAPFPMPQTLLPHVSKPLEEQLGMQASSCTAAFTSSSHNMAFTAAMVSPTKMSSPPASQSGLDDHDLYQHPQLDQGLEQQLSQSKPPTVPILPIEESPAAAVATAFLNSVSEAVVPEAPVVSEKAVLEPTPVEQAKRTPTHPGKKSPSKPTRTSARVTSQQGKSPGKSPRQQPQQQQQEREAKPAQSRGRGRGSKSSQANNRSRGRGRGRGRSKAAQQQQQQQQHSSSMHLDDSIQHKLVGTVYDFDSDEDSPGETNIADLRTMRERKKSSEVSSLVGSERRDSFSGLANESLTARLSSPTMQRNLHKGYEDGKRTQAAASSPSMPGDDSTIGAESESGAGQAFGDQVLPLLPGPVDMRTYSSGAELGLPGSALHGQAYGNHLLGSFAAVSAEHGSIPDMEEDLDKELQSALLAKQQPDLGAAGVVPHPLDAAAAVEEDPRNQLKMKIKGPFRDSNYVASSAASAPLAQQPHPAIAPAANSLAVGSGTSNLRRMRKKELLRQYVLGSATDEALPMAPAVIPPIISRNVITIPKAVASMTSIPTREDYKDFVVDANLDKKRRKERASVGSNIIDGHSEDEPQQLSERRRSAGGATGNNERRRGRQTRPSAQQQASSADAAAQAPKLKIKIGNNVLPGQEAASSAVVAASTSSHEMGSSLRPPKKRLSHMPPSSVSMEDLRRDSMKFRKQIFAEFDSSSGGGEKVTKIKREKKDKNGKSKKKKQKDPSGKKETGCVQILADGNKPKLIIRLGKSNQSSGDESAALGLEPPASSTNSATATTTTSSSTTAGAAASDSSTKNNSQDRLAAPPSTTPEEETPAAGKSEPTPPEAKPAAGAQLEHSSVSALRNVRCAKVSPIRLKLTRCQEGYELKSPGHAATEEQSAEAAKSQKPETPKEKRDAEQRLQSDKSGESDDKRKKSKQQAEAPPSSKGEGDDKVSALTTGCPPAPIPQGCQVR